MRGGFRAYSWDGEPITEPIEQWAEKHGHRMMRVKITERHMNPYSGAIWYEDYEEDLPEPFTFQVSTVDRRVDVLGPSADFGPPDQ